MTDFIEIVSAVIANSQNQILVVRKHGTTVFIQPGGKREPEENLIQTLARELQEELGLRLILDSVRRLGEFEALAAHEQSRRVRAQVFICETDGVPRCAAEIAELRWIDPNAHTTPLAQLSAAHILPAYLRYQADHFKS